MKYQLNLPARTVTKAHAVISFLLVALLLFFSFGSIFVIDVDGDVEDLIEEGAEMLAEEIPALEDIDIPDEIEVTPGKIVDSVSILVDFVRVMMNEAKGATTSVSDAEQEEMDELKEAFEDKIESDEGIEAIVMSIFLTGQIIDFSDIEEADDSEPTFADLLLIIFKLVIIISLLFFVVWTPVYLAFLTIVGLVKLIKKLCGKDNSESVSASMNKMAVKIIGACMLLTFLAGLGVGGGLEAMLIVTIIGIVINVCVTRLRAYKDKDFMALNLVQGASLVAGIGIAVYAVNFINSGFIQSFISSIGDYLAKLTTEMSAINSQIDAYNTLAEMTGADTIGAFVPGSAFIIDIVLMFAFGVWAFAFVKSATSEVLADISTNHKKKNSGCSFLGLGISSVLTCVIPFVLTAMENAKSYKLKEITEDGAEIKEKAAALFEMNSDAESALTAMIVGAVLILAAGIAYKVLYAKLAAKYAYTPTDEILLLAGNAPAYVAAPAEEAPAEEAPVEEAPAEEAPAEEAPAEEAPEEEAPAEEPAEV